MRALERINDRYDVRTSLDAAGPRRDLVVEDSWADSRLKVLSVWTEDPGASLSFGHYRILRSVLCPSLLVPDEFHRMYSVDGSPYQGDGWCYTRPFVAGDAATESLSSFSPSLLLQYIETELYLERVGRPGAATDLGLWVLSSDDPPVLSLTDLSPDGDRPPLSEGLRTILEGSGEDLGELAGILEDPGAGSPRRLVALLSERFDTVPSARNLLFVPPRYSGYHSILKKANAFLGRCRRDDLPGVVILEGTMPHGAFEIREDLLSRTEVQGWLCVRLASMHAEELERDIAVELHQKLPVLPGADSLPDPETDPLGFLVELSKVQSCCVSLSVEEKGLRRLAEFSGKLLASGCGRGMAFVARTPERRTGSDEKREWCEIIHLAERARPEPVEFLSAVLATDQVPEGLLMTLDRYRVFEPTDILTVIKYMLDKRILSRTESGWSFSLSRERIDGLTGHGRVSLEHVLRLGEPDRSVLALLIHTGRSLGRRFISHTVDRPVEEVSEALVRLADAGLAHSGMEREVTVWAASAKVPKEFLKVDDSMTANWNDRLVGYALVHPSPALSELLAAIDCCGDEPNARANLVYSALLFSMEELKPELTDNLLDTIATLPRETLSPSQRKTILYSLKPRKLSGLNTRRTRDVIEEWVDSLPDAASRALALIRLAELDILHRDRAGARARLGEALRSSLEESYQGREIYLALSAMVEAVEGDESEKAVNLVGQALQRCPVDVPSETRVRIFSCGGAALANAGMQEDAEKALQGAGALVSTADPRTKMLFEWCRGRVLLKGNRLAEAIQALERALLLARNLDDHTAVTEILSLTVSCQERLPGYTLRSMTSDMEEVRKMMAGGIANAHSLYGLGRLAGLYARTMSFSKSWEVIRELQSVPKGPLSFTWMPYVEWFEAFMDYQLGRPVPEPEGEELLAGTHAFLGDLRRRNDPIDAAGRIADSLKRQKSTDLVPLGIYLALEAAARGRGEAARTLASTLTDTYRPKMAELIPGWRLCINALLAPRAFETEKALVSGQVMARQLDRLLLVWLILQVRLSLDVGEMPQREAEIRLMLEEIDRYLEDSVDEELGASFRGQEHVRLRREQLFSLTGALETSVPALRDSLFDSLGLGESLDLSSLRGLPRETTRSSGVGWGLEALRSFSKASRVRVVKLDGQELSLLESRGYGSNVPPDDSVVDAMRKLGPRPHKIDNFGRTPYGSRQMHIVPLGRQPVPLGIPERRSSEDEPARGNFLILEMESPFDQTSGVLNTVCSCLIKQISASIALHELEEQTYYDSMTGAVIRAVWFSKLGEMLKSEVTPRKPLGILMIDLDFFKSVNDGFGHREGDRVLKSVVSSVKGALRPTDVVGRLGGEEFGVLLPTASEKNATMVAERVRKKVAKDVFRPDRRAVTVSIGVAVAPIHGEAPELLVRRADVALYESKSRGRNRTTLWKRSMNTTVMDHEPASLMDTGDPGWDHLLGQTILQILGTREMSMEHLADQLRNALRCEYLELLTGSGKTTAIGMREVEDSLQSVELGSPKAPKESMSSDWKYYALGSELSDGGRIVAAWRAEENRPRSMPTLFAALANLADMLLLFRGSSVPAEDGGA
ncbi:diguanylate cyclase [Candidatus Fermentibacteria bacterium]|nr:diguanylate cyclase [Candidatus Fermentibacteria bacterium]